MNIKAISIFLILGVILTVVTYALILLYIIHPISVLSVEKVGVFGDSFGILTSLFTGLAFSGMIITILLQREELELQRKELAENRKEFTKSADAQERSAQLSALSAMLNECDIQLKKTESELENNKYLKDNAEFKHILRNTSIVEQEIESLKERKALIMKNIEEILKCTGVHLIKT